MPKVFVDWLNGGYRRVLAAGLEFLGPATGLRPGVRVAVKPNLTFPHFRPGVMTTLEAIQAVVEGLREYTDTISICEADSGGYNRFCVEDVFRATGLDDLARRYGIRLLNLSRLPQQRIRVPTRWRRLEVPLPAWLLHEVDLLVTVPVPKVHANTVLSGAVKNQWGVIPDPTVRLRLHPCFSAVIWAIHQALPRTLVVMDGRWGLNRNGPMRGEPVELNWLLVSDSVLFADLAMAELLGFSPRQVPHLREGCRRQGVRSLAEAECNRQLDEFRKAPFRLERAWTDLPGWLAFRWRSLAWLAYESPFAQLLHRMLYLVREPFY
ncbi:MAG: DUF362 domain-containing protein [Bryobacterales bacterium]|nr:DUF362 domain-containing protein [Bryobacteraceae bacterium]MDW8355181.1 DUF362 domain-containing protein [Bryobacterales bacterium]